MKDKTLRKFLLWAFALAWPLQALASWLALNEALPAALRQSAFTLVMAVSMFAPLAALLLAKIPLKSLGWRPNLKGNVGRYLAAWLVPIALVALGAALFYAIFPAAFDASASSYFSTLPEEALQAYEAQGLSRGLLIIVSILGAVSYAPFINILFSLGEEAGWRGYLYPRLKERFGKTRGRLLAGVIWGVWHWPVIILAGYEYGLDYWGAPVAGPLLFCVFTVAIGTLLDWLYEKTGSIWAASLGHGAINAVANLPVMFLVASYADRSILGPFANGLIGGLPLILLAAAVLVKKEKA